MPETEKIHQIFDSGKYAVAIVGFKGWRRDSAIGDGITSALSALVTRCATLVEAKSLAERLNNQQPRVRPGSVDVPVYAACKYLKSDYLSAQQRRNGQSRGCDRKIVHL